MKIKDLSSSYRVAGEGILCWSIQDATGTLVHIELFGYHIPNVYVNLLSPQVLMKTLGGHALQTIDKGINISLENGIDLYAQYCHCSNLFMIPLAIAYNAEYFFLTDAFGYSANGYHEINAIKSVLNHKNSHLPSSQKKVLLWHQCLSHEYISWVQTLLQD
jgi:hypothetical protein